MVIIVEITAVLFSCSIPPLPPSPHRCIFFYSSFISQMHGLRRRVYSSMAEPQHIPGVQSSLKSSAPQQREAPASPPPPGFILKLEADISFLKALPPQFLHTSISSFDPIPVRNSLVSLQFRHMYSCIGIFSLLFSCQFGGRLTTGKAPTIGCFTVFWYGYNIQETALRFVLILFLLKSPVICPEWILSRPLSLPGRIQ